MNNVPAKLRKKWKFEDIMGIKRVCMRSDEGDCKGRLTKEHSMYFAGSQLQEDWAILDICAYHTAVDQYQDTGKMNKEKHVWIALNRASDTDLVRISKSLDYIALRGRLNAKYGIYKVDTTNIPAISYAS